MLASSQLRRQRTDEQVVAQSDVSQIGQTTNTRGDCGREIVITGTKKHEVPIAAITIAIAITTEAGWNGT
jgi:hypothetical protein